MQTVVVISCMIFTYFCVFLFTLASNLFKYNALLYIISELLVLIAASYYFLETYYCLVIFQAALIGYSLSYRPLQIKKSQLLQVLIVVSCILCTELFYHVILDGFTLQDFNSRQNKKFVHELTDFLLMIAFMYVL